MGVVVSTERIRPNQFSLELPSDLREGLEKLKEQHGAPVAVSIRRAIAAYLEAQGIGQKGGAQKTKRRK
jgi:hypothetical protein